MRGKLVLGLLAIIMISTIVVAALPKTTVATGTLTGSTASALSFSAPVNQILVINNRDAQAAYILLNDNATTPLVSTSNYDFVLDQNEFIVLDGDYIKNNPVQTIGVYSTATTPTVRVTGI